MKYSLLLCCLFIYSAKFNTELGDNKKLIVKGDSWFGSVRAAAALAQRGIQSILQIKTGHSLYPKDFIDEVLCNCPGGVHVVLEGIHPDGMKLIAIGYRYSSKKTLFFVMSEFAGSTTKGDPYEMKFTDEHGNIGELCHDFLFTFINNSYLFVLFRNPICRQTRRYIKIL